MRIQVDQSGKVEQLDTATVVAGSNGEKQAIVVSAGAKRRITPMRISLPGKSTVPRNINLQKL